jgi:hypothetical protein
MLDFHTEIRYNIFNPILGTQSALFKGHNTEVIMAKYSKFLAQEIASYTNEGLEATHKHYSGIQALARQAGEGDVVEEIGVVLEQINQLAKTRNFSLTVSV